MTDLAEMYRHIDEFAKHARRAAEHADQSGEEVHLVGLIVTEHVCSVLHTLSDDDGNPQVLDLLAHLTRAANQIVEEQGGVDAEAFRFEELPLFPEIPDQPA